MFCFVLFLLQKLIRKINLSGLFKVDHQKQLENNQMEANWAKHAAYNEVKFYQDYSRRNRIPVSEALQTLIDYIQKNQSQDFLVSSGQFALPNPFKEKSACVLL